MASEKIERVNMGDYIPLSVNTPRKIEISRIARESGRSRHEALGLLTDFWCWVSVESCNGELPGVSVSVLCDLIGGDESFWAAVQAQGWLADGESGLWVPNADRWLTRTAKSRLEAREKKRKQRAGRHGRSGGQSGDSNGTKASGRGGEKASQNDHDGTSSGQERDTIGTERGPSRDEHRDKNGTRLTNVNVTKRNVTKLNQSLVVSGSGNLTTSLPQGAASESEVVKTSSLSEPPSADFGGEPDVTRLRREQLVEDILAVTHDQDRAGLYRKISRRMPDGQVRRALAEVRAAQAVGEADDPGKLFTHVVKRIAGEQNIDLGFKSRGAA